MRVPKRFVEGLVENDNDLGSTGFSISNNQSSPANITGFVFSNAAVRSFEAIVSIEIDADSDLFEEIQILGIQKGSDWDISIQSTGDDTLINLSITSSGQMQYTSANYAGFSSGEINFRAITTEL